MARKQRKTELFRKSDALKGIRVGGYIRLSVLKETVPLDSVENQIRIINDCLAQHPTWELYRFYIDTNASGMHFHRKAFEELQEDIEAGLVNCVIVKDLSRLGRNVIETGKCMEEYFPQHEVRFISVNDEIDTLDGIFNLSDERPTGAPFKNVMNEAIVRDIQKKTRFTLDAFAKEGKYIAPRAPYGYLKSPDDKHQLIVDPEAAYTVRVIFAMASQRTPMNQIVRQLNSQQVPPPMQYALQNGVSSNYAEGNGLWNTRTIQKILANRTYAGDLLQGRNQVLVLDTHEAIISREQFEEVQRILSENITTGAKSVETTEANPLRGKVHCACCGGKMQRKRGSGHADWHFFICITRNRMGAERCSGMYIREQPILDAVQTVAKQYIAEHSDQQAPLLQKRNELQQELKRLAPQVEDSSGYKRAQYERMIEGEISTEEFLQAKEKLYCSDKRYKSVRDELNNVEKEIERFERIKSAGTNEIYFEVKTVTVASSDRIAVEFR